MASPQRHKYFAETPSDNASTTSDEKGSSEIVGSIESFVVSLSSQFNCADMSDIVLTVGDKSYYAHRLLLANSSDVLKTMLTENRWEESKKHTIELTETPQCTQVFEKFLRFMYSGQIQMTTSSVLPILTLSDKYNVERLTMACAEYMRSQVSERQNIKGALLWWGPSKMYQLESLDNQCLQLIKRNLNEAMVLDEWLNLDLDQILAILRMSDIVVKNEYTLYQGTERWILDKPKKRQSEFLSCILPHIHFSQMTPILIDAIEKSELCTKHRGKCAQYFFAAYKQMAMEATASDGSSASIRTQGSCPRIYSFLSRGNTTCVPLNFGGNGQDIVWYHFDVKCLTTRAKHSFPAASQEPRLEETGYTGDLSSIRLSLKCLSLSPIYSLGLSANHLLMRFRCERQYRALYEICVQLKDEMSGETLSVINASGRVGDEDQHLKFVHDRDQSILESLDRLYRDGHKREHKETRKSTFGQMNVAGPSAVGFNRAVTAGSSYNHHSCPNSGVQCTFLGINADLTNMKLMIHVTFRQ